MRTSNLLAAIAFAVVAVPATRAHAQTDSGGASKQTTSTYTEAKTSDGSAVVFKDDLTTADGLSAAGAVLKVRGAPARFILIKPRMNFIDSLRKSVENL